MNVLEPSMNACLPFELVGEEGLLSPYAVCVQAEICSVTVIIVFPFIDTKLCHKNLYILYNYVYNTMQYHNFYFILTH